MRVLTNTAKIAIVSSNFSISIAKPMECKPLAGPCRGIWERSEFPTTKPNGQYP